MATTATSDRASMMGMMDMGMMRNMSAPSMGMPSMMGGNMTGMNPAGMNMMMVPRCTMKVEKIANGMKMMCMCDDAMAARTMQNLCNMMAGGMMSCCMMMNGMPVMNCNMMMGMCKVEMTDTGCVVTCTSGDAACCKMIQCCCDCMAAMLAAGCTSCMMMNGMPMCCGC